MLAVAGDRKLAKSVSGPAIQWFEPDVLSSQQYYPFGMLMPGWQYAAGGYVTLLVSYNLAESMHLNGPTDTVSTARKTTTQAGVPPAYRIMGLGCIIRVLRGF